MSHASALGMATCSSLCGLTTLSLFHSSRASISPVRQRNVIAQTSDQVCPVPNTARGSQLAEGGGGWPWLLPLLGAVVRPPQPTCTPVVSEIPAATGTEHRDGQSNIFSLKLMFNKSHGETLMTASRCFSIPRNIPKPAPVSEMKIIW